MPLRIRPLHLLVCLILLALTAPANAAPPADLRLELITGGLSSPVAVRNAGDGTDRLFIVQRGGSIRIVENGSLLATPFITVPNVLSGGELGLLGMAFHPDYDTNGYFYVNYTRNPPGPIAYETVIARFEVSAGNPNVANVSSLTELLTITQDDSNHNGGDIHFGPDGYLYTALGDGGGGGDPFDRAQDLGELLGKMLRLDVDGGTPYAIPAGNPFNDEIWAYGLRNPWRFSFDRWSGDIFIGDVGQGSWEEISYQRAGTPGGINFGWDCREGAHNFPGGSTCSGPTVDPIMEYVNTSFGGDCAVVGGFRYSGIIPGFQSIYTFADNCSGKIWFGTQATNGTWSDSLWMDTNLSVSGFGEDEDGELYLVSLSGALYRFTSDSAIFGDNFESGGLGLWSGSVQ
ncbi:MAG: PQQ-dependent sugar dehydrogenase [Acidobacteriota bacterium]